MATAVLGITVGSSAASADSSGAVRYPIVLVHGLSGFDSLLGIDYFYGVKSALSGVGASQVYTPQIAAFESNEVRGEELLAYVEEVLVVTGAAKVNLIGHSQGGTTARYVAAVRPDLVASVTSVGSPHFGSNVADIVQGSPLQEVAVAIGNAFGGLIALFSGDPGQQANFVAALESLNTAGAVAYNTAYPAGVRTGSCRSTAHQVSGVRYYSWSGVYNPVFNSSVFDPIDGIMGGLSLLHNGADNDGLVARCSTHLGDVIRDDYTQNHLDEVNGLFGLRGLWTSAPLPIYTAHARRLKDAGL
ncbi:UNVERIFIED_CONTAM: hypothetical protein GTU68_034903 [Idotea baltica]|nr:hypothetical protein [Idotea baltica]